MYKVPIIILLMSLYSCHSNKAKEINSLILSNNKEDIIYCCYLIGEYKQTEHVEYLFKNIEDSRVTNDLRFKGMSVYQSSAIALKKLSGLDPPNKVSYQPDTAIINFYKRWALQNKYISK